MTRSSPSGGFRIDTSGGANALALDNIIFSDAVDVMSSTTDVVPLVESTPEALGSGSIVRVEACEFRDFVNGTFFIGSFSSDVPGDGSSVFDVRSSVFVNNMGVDLLLPNSTQCCGGAIDIDSPSNSAISIVASEFSINNATGDGGAVRIFSDVSVGNGPSSVLIESTLFRMNSGSAGGALLIEGGMVGIQNSIFTGNAATGEVPLRGGGAVFIKFSDDALVANSAFTNNTSTDVAGAISLDDSGDVLITNSSFTNNVAAGRSGGALNIFFTENPTNIENSSFANNTALTFGGAVNFFAGGGLNIRDSTFTGNTAPRTGGGVYALGSRNFTCVRSSFIENFTGEVGGGLFTANVGPLNFTANAFVRNEAEEEGGGFFSTNSDFVTPSLFTNVSNVFIDNTAPSFPNGFAEGFSNTS